MSIRVYPFHGPPKFSIPIQALNSVIFPQRRALLLSTANCSVLFAPRHTLWCFSYYNPTPLKRSIKLCFSLRWLLAPSFLLQHKAPRCSILLGMIKFALDACKIIVVMVNSLGRGEVRPLHILCRVSEAATLRPLLVAFDTGKRAGEGEASGTAVFVGVDMA